MIIKLTEVRNSTKELCAMYVNTDQIQYFGRSINGSDTRLKIADNGYMFVKESPEEVFAMIYPPPIVADASVLEGLDEIYSSHIVRMK